MSPDPPPKWKNPRTEHRRFGKDSKNKFEDRTLSLALRKEGDKDSGPRRSSGSYFPYHGRLSHVVVTLLRCQCIIEMGMDHMLKKSSLCKWAVLTKTGPGIS